MNLNQNSILLILFFKYLGYKVSLGIKRGKIYIYIYIYYGPTMHCWFIFNVPIISNNVTCRTFVKQLLILNESSNLCENTRAV